MNWKRFGRKLRTPAGVAACVIWVLLLLGVSALVLASPASAAWLLSALAMGLPAMGMAVELVEHTHSYEAAEDLSDYQYHIVVLSSAGKIRLPDAATDIPYGVLLNAPESGEPCTVAPIGSGNLCKVVASTALAIGDLVGLEYVGAADAGKAQALTLAQYPVGVVIEASTAEDEFCTVLLLPGLRTLNWKGGSNTVAADVLAIPVTKTNVAKTTGADAEALTLANGVPGQILSIALVVDGGGDGTLTPTTATGWSTIVFADKGDNVALLYVDDTVGWVILGTAGVAAPPVISLV